MTTPVVKSASPKIDEGENTSLEAELEAEVKAPPIPMPPQTEMLDDFDRMNSFSETLKQKPICEILCGKSRFSVHNKDRALFEILDFFKREQERAFADAGFLLAVQKLRLQQDLLPKPMRELVTELENFDSLNETDKALFAIKAEFAVGRFIFNLKRFESESRRLNIALDRITRLKKQCTSKNSEATSKDCFALDTPW